MFEPDGFIPLDSSRLKDLLHTYDNDSAIQKVVKITNDSLFAGSVLVYQEGDDLDDIVHTSNSEVWESWSRNNRRHMDAIGFVIASYIDDEDQGRRIPTIMNLDHLTLRYFIDEHSMPHLKVYKYEGFRQVEIDPNSYQAFFEKPPTKDGLIQSRVSMMFKDSMIENEKLMHSQRAERMLADPPIILESVENKQDEQTLQSVITHLNPRVDTMENRESALLNSNPNQKAVSMTDGSEGTASITTMLNSMTGAEQSMLMRQIQLNAVTSPQGQIRLPPEYKLVTNTTPTNLSADYILFRANRNETVCLLWGVPFSMFSNSSTTSKSSMGNGNNDNAMTIFNNSQNQRKVQLRRNIQKHYNWAFSMVNILNTIQEHNRKKRKYDEIELVSSEMNKKVIVEIPGIPDERVLVWYFKLGILKYDVLPRVAGALHGLRKTDFHDKPQLTLEEVNGIQIEEEKQN
jgi:hypothetical protein